MNMEDVYEDFPDDCLSDGDDLLLTDEDLAQALDGIGSNDSHVHRPQVTRSEVVEFGTDVRHEPRRQSLQNKAGQLPSDELLDFDRFLVAFTEQHELGRETKPKTNALAAASPEEPVPTVKPPQLTTNHGSIPIIEGGNQVETSERPCHDAKETKATLSSSWGVFSPDKMPTRRDSSTMSSTKCASSSPRKLKVLVPSVAFLRTKQRAAGRRADQQQSRELTFRPTINNDYFRRVGVGRLRVRRGIQFAARMQEDIAERQDRQKRRIQERQLQQEEDEQRYRQRRRSLIAKGSEAILQRNGLWDEPHEQRLERLLQENKTRLGKNASHRMSDVKKRARQEKELAKARACEALYRRAVDKLARFKLAQDSPAETPMRNAESSRRSERVVRQKLDRDVRMICQKAPAKSSLPATVSFVEFSCVLLYFGLVPHANTPWQDAASHGETLLWHAWSVLSQGDGDQRCVSMASLKSLLEAVIMKPQPSPRRSSTAQSATPTAKPTATLMSILRLNYLSRKRPTGGPGQRVEQQNHQAKADRVQVNTHGRPVRSRRSQDFLNCRHEEAQRRVAQLRREREEQELAQCTFKPQISYPSSTDKRDLLRNYSLTDDDVPETFDRLYADHFVRQSNLSVRHQQAKQEADEKWKKETRISPTYVNGMTIDERLKKLHESLSNNALPVQYHEKIHEMRQAYAAKLEDAEEKARRLETPAHEYPRTKEGRTLVVPFTFATQERGNRSLRRGTATSSPSNHHGGKIRGTRRQSTSALIRELRLNYAAPSSGHDRVDADVCIDVHVSPFETYQLFVDRGDDVYETVRAFGDAYNLDDGQRQQLQLHAERTLKELLDL